MTISLIVVQIFSIFIYNLVFVIADIAFIDFSNKILAMVHDFNFFRQEYLQLVSFCNELSSIFTRISTSNNLQANLMQLFASKV